MRDFFSAPGLDPHNPPEGPRGPIGSERLKRLADELAADDAKLGRCPTCHGRAVVFTGPCPDCWYGRANEKGRPRNSLG